MEQIWDNISVGEFIELRTIITDESRDAESKKIAIAALLQGVTEDELLDMPLAEAHEAFELAEQLNSRPKRARVRTIYRVGPWTLRATEAQEMSVAQWVDFQTYGREMEKHLVDILSVALVPEGKSYNDGYDIEKLKVDITNKMMIPDALAVCFFFQRRWLKSMHRILTFLVGWTSLKGWKEPKEKAMEARREISALLHSR